jgi:RND family efflux transporter MFP subunit
MTSSVIAQEEQEQPPAALVETESVNSEMIADKIWVPGTVVSRTDANIAAEVAGRINWLADVGDIVEVGQPLAKLDDRRLQLTLQQNSANIAQWQSRVDLLVRKVERFESMALQKATSKDQLDEVRSELEVAQQELVQAKYDKELTQYQIDQSKVTAPFTAMVVERMQAPGEYTVTGQSLLRIVDTQNIEASARAPLSAIPYIRANMAVDIAQQSTSMEKTIRTIVPVGNAQSRMMEVRVQLSPQDFAIGSAVRVALPHSEFHQGLTVPRDALVLRKSGTFIYQVDEQNIAKRVNVQTGIGVGDRVEVIGQIFNDYPVVIRGAERLKDGELVRFNDAHEGLTASNL